MSNPPSIDLTQQGLAAARVGDIEDARRMLQTATEQTPDNIDAWLGLAGIVETLPEKESCFRQVLAIDPNNGEAQAGLALVQQKLAVVKPVEVSKPAQPLAEDKPTPTDTGLTYCYYHPQIQTGLRCNRCNKPICPKCARRMPVGFRCPDCIREQENKYYSGGNLDYLLALVIALPLSLVSASIFSFVIGALGWFLIWISLFAAPVVAGFMAEIVRWAVKKRRSRYLGRLVAGCFMLGFVPVVLVMLLVGNIYGLIAAGIFIFVGTATILARLR